MNDGNQLIHLFHNFCRYKYPYTDNSLIPVEAIEDFLNTLIPSSISGFPVEIVTRELKRVYDVNMQFFSLLNYPIISYSPLVVDINRYKKAMAQKETSYYLAVDSGYYEIVDLFSNNNAVIIRKLSDDRFKKLMLNRNIISRLEQNDVLHLLIHQKPSRGWEVKQYKGCYPRELNSGMFFR